MFQRVATVCLLTVVVAAAVPAGASAQAVPNPTQQGVTTPGTTQQSVATPQGDVPVFRVTVVGRTVPAVNYRPRSGETRIDFAGTTLMPKAKGQARVEGEDGVIKIDAKFEDLLAAQRFGREYMTYVLWAITPEGRATNLGEVQVDGDDAKLEVTTELQSFALIVTAEPYFAVSQPSDVVVIENVVREDGFNRTRGRVETLQAKYELLRRGSYLMNEDPSALKVKSLEPGAPLDLGQARNAVELARLAKADRYASESFNKAASLLSEAEKARERGKRGNEVQQPARQAAQTAEDARLISLQRQEVEFEEQQRKLALQREEDAAARLRAEEARRRQAEEDRLRVEGDRQRAETALAAAERERLAAERARVDLERARAEADAARAAAQAQADEAKRLAAEREAEAAAARQAREQAERDREAAREQLRQQLNVILETRETARGLIVNLSDVLFDVDKATLKPGAREKLARVAGILGSHPDLKIEIEGHADSTGSDDYNQRLSERRAQSVRAYLGDQGIGQSVVSAVGFGESRPVATNGTASGRQQNRRVEIIVSGESIGRSSN
jgi:outer membrane protein OmpA-like peptidoglycan-associated protein